MNANANVRFICCQFCWGINNRDEKQQQQQWKEIRNQWRGFWMILEWKPVLGRGGIWWSVLLFLLWQWTEAQFHIVYVLFLCFFFLIIDKQSFSFNFTISHSNSGHWLLKVVDSFFGSSQIIVVAYSCLFSVVGSCFM